MEESFPVLEENWTFKKSFSKIGESPSWNLSILLVEPNLLLEELPLVTKNVENPIGGKVTVKTAI